MANNMSSQPNILHNSMPNQNSMFLEPPNWPINNGQTGLSNQGGYGGGMLARATSDSALHHTVQNRIQSNLNKTTPISENYQNTNVNGIVRSQTLGPSLHASHSNVSTTFIKFERKNS